MPRIVALWLLTLCVVPARAQMLELQPGVRARVSAPPLLSSRYDAVVGARHGDTLTLVRVGSPSLEVPISAITVAEIFRGRSRRRGAMTGLKWGTIAGLVYGAVDAFGPDSAQHAARGDGQFDCPREAVTCDTWTDTEGVIYSTITGAAAGTLIGFLIGRGRWQRLQGPAHLSLELIHPVPGGRRPATARLGAHFAF